MDQDLEMNVSVETKTAEQAETAQAEAMGKNETVPETLPESEQSENRLFSALEKVFSGGLYLALCIVFSVGVLLESADGIPSVINILIAVGMWLTYSFARTKGKLERKVGHLDFLRIPLLIQQIMLIVATATTAVTGVVTLISTLFTNSLIKAYYRLIRELIGELLNTFAPEFVEILEPILLNVFGTPSIEAFLEQILHFSGWFSVVSLLIGTVTVIVGMLISCLFNGAMLSAVKAFKDALRGKKIRRGAFKAARAWLIVMGIYSCLTANIFTGAVMILAFVLAGNLIDALKREKIW